MALPRLLPKPSRNSPPAPEPEPDKQRKRGMNHTACNPCRAKREKCSGQRPKCHACERHGRDCVYAAPQGVTRQQANKQKLAEAERSSSYLRDVIELLRQGSEADAAIALSRIREVDQVDEDVNILPIAQALATPIPTMESASGYGSRPDEAVSPQGMIQAPGGRSRSSSYAAEFVESTLQAYIAQDRSPTKPAPDLSISRWTSACDDNRLLNHLISMVWTYDNMVEPSLFRPLLEEDLSNENSTFCSPFLVNALLALGCLLTTDDATFADLEGHTTRGRNFAEEAEKHFQKEKNQPSIPLLQGQFAMFAYEGNLDGGTKAMDYFMGTVETYEALNHSDFLNRQSSGKDDARLQREIEGLSWVMWGFYCSEWRASQAFGFQNPVAKPLIAKLWRNSSFPLRQPDSACYWWSPYPESRRLQRSMKVEIREANSYLSEIAEDVLDYLYPSFDTPSATINPQRAVELYDTLARWKLSLPAQLRIEDAILPSAILLHSYVELLLGDILRPFSHFTKTQFGLFCPKDRCYAHCISLMQTIWTFRAFSSLNGEYWYIPMLATVALMTLREHKESPMLTEALIKACKCLREMTTIYPLAFDALRAIRGAFKRTRMPVPSYLQSFLEAGVAHTTDGLLHHAAAKLMPDAGLSSQNRSEVRYQELLDELDDVELKSS